VARKLIPLTLLVMLAGAGAAAAAPVQTLPLDRIRPGQKGYGLTVFSGFKIERFQVEVIEVLRNFLPKQDLFLIRIDHPVLRKTGVVGGMSGSPIYIEGKLAGALAYGWRFSKEPIAGVTPIANMLELIKRKTRGPAHAGFASRSRPRGEDLPRLAASGLSVGQLAPVTVPVAAAGFSSEALSLLRRELAPYGMEPVQGGGTGRAEGPTRFEPGGSLGVELVSGDVSLTSTGTVTWTDGKRVLGFGHRMLNAGEIYLPAGTAKIVHTLASMARSFKISSPARQLGSLVQDRQPGILVDTGRRLGTIPMRLTLKSDRFDRVYNVRLARHRILTPTLVRTVVANGVSEAMADVAHATFTIDTRLEIKGHKPLRIVEHHYADAGIRLPLTLFSRGLATVHKVLDNDFQPLEIRRIDVGVKVRFAPEIVTIEAVRLSTAQVEPGSRINLQVVFKPFGGPEFSKSYPLQIPRDISGSLLEVEVASGKQVQPDLAPPRTLEQYLANLQRSYPARAVVVTLKTPARAVKMQGHVIRDLPPSVLDALNASTIERQGSMFYTHLREVHPTRRVVTGKKKLRIRVETEDGQ
jgi:hypothetical protein